MKTIGNQLAQCNYQPRGLVTAAGLLIAAFGAYMFLPAYVMRMGNSAIYTFSLAFGRGAHFFGVPIILAFCFIALWLAIGIVAANLIFYAIKQIKYAKQLTKSNNHEQEGVYHESQSAQ